MEEIKYKGSILNNLFKIAEKYPKLTIGQILHSISRPKSLNGNSVVVATDESIYKITEELLKNNILDDEIYTEEEFNTWLDGK